jgi:hypothetical protein
MLKSQGMYNTLYIKAQAYCIIVSKNATSGGVVTIDTL